MLNNQQELVVKINNNIMLLLLNEYNIKKIQYQILNCFKNKNKYNKSKSQIALNIT